MKSEVRRSDFHAFGFCSLRKKSELSSPNQKKTPKKQQKKTQKIVKIDLKGKHNE